MKVLSIPSCAVALGIAATATLAHHAFPTGGDSAASLYWSSLNATVGGRLIQTVPLGAPCHDPSYDEATCESLRSQWQWETIHMESSSSVMTPLFANQSCDPFQPRARPCELGNYVRYAVDATGADDVRAAIAFAQSRNVRFVTRNTGHDFLGRSTGAGALAVWTHHLKNIEFLEWGYEILRAARDRGLVVVGGECTTVGIAGGYTQGGGHSALSTNFGLSADNVLSWEVVTADGELRTASRTEEADLYWALGGGGGSTFGVVVSVTAKAFPDAVVSGATLSFDTADNGHSTESLYAGIDAFHEALPAMVDAGTMVVSVFNTSSFSIMSLTAYNKTQEDVQGILEPFESALESLGVNYTAAFTQSDTYHDHIDTYFGPLPQGIVQVGIWHYGARLIPALLSDAWRFVIEQGATWTGVATDVSSFDGSDKTGGGGGGGSNSVHPAWRDALVHAVLYLPWSFEAPWADMVALLDKMTDVIIPAIEAATPGSGAYVNEADWRQPNFQETFWGTNYPRLLDIKKKYDPDDFFYATVGVGSEVWVVDEDGRMCAAAAGPKAWKSKEFL
ncbi:uncharacterized protein PG986_015122 [Apiospora aurea]|uniref:FAD-binding PCMH-type domain-containing protein n=1 Tax=Apiospora aurea TaxID=335848 RepID=A0ABR1PS53_9PEZI